MNQITAVLRDYNGLIITRDGKGEVTSYKADDKTETIRQKNKEKFGNRDEEGRLVKNGKKSEDEHTARINESNKRYKKWQQEQQ